MKTQHLQYPGVVKKIFILYLVLIVNTGYLMAFSHENWFYAANVILHFVIGALVILPFLKWARLFLRHDARHGKPFGRNAGRMGYAFMLLAALTGCILAYKSLFFSHPWLSTVHGILGILACLFMISSIRRAGYNISVDNIYSRAGRWGLVVFISSGVFVLMAHGLRSVFPNQDHVIENSVILPLNEPENAGNRDEYPFYPSALKAENDDLEHDFLLNSESCGTAGCHPDIVAQWKASAHSRASLHNERYRQALQYLEKRMDRKTLKYCAGCHSPAVLVSGTAEKPVEEWNSLRDPGVGCQSCHAIQRVENTLGNAGFHLKRPALTPLSQAGADWQRLLYAWILNAAPDMHRRSMMQPFHRKQSSEFCSTCHEISLEPPVLSQGWSSGPNHYDSWRLSAFGGSPVMSFFPAQKKQSCLDCHMPRVPSQDAGNKDGLVRDHRFSFPAAVELQDARPPVHLHVIPVSAFASDAPDSISPAAADSDSNHDVENALPATAMPLDVVIAPVAVGHFLPFGAFETRRFFLHAEMRSETGDLLWEKTAEQLEGLSGADNGKKPRFAFGTQHAAEAADLKPLQSILPGAAGTVRLTIPVSVMRAKQGKLQLKFVAQQYSNVTTSNGAQPGGTVLAESTLEWTVRKGVWQILDSLNAEAWNHYGAALFLQKQWSRARQAFQRAIQENPQELQYQVNLARTWLASGDIDSAKSILMQVLQKDKRHPSANFFLSQCFKLEKDYRQAKKHLRRAKRKYKDDVFLLLAEGEIYFLQESYKKAIRALRRVILRHPENAIAHYYRMLANQKLGQSDKAEYEGKLYQKFAVRKLQTEPISSYIEPEMILPPIYQHFLLPEKNRD